MQYLITDKWTGRRIWVTLEQAAEIIDLTPDEVEVAIEEFGEYETDRLMIIRPE